MLEVFRLLSVEIGKVVFVSEREERIHVLITRTIVYRFDEVSTLLRKLASTILYS